MPAWRNVSFVPAARPLCSIGAELSATFVTAGLNRPVPMQATRMPGSVAVHDEVSPASVIRPMPTPTSASPTPIIVRAGTLEPSSAVAPETNSITTVPGRYTRPASIADRPRICCRYSVV